MFMGRLDRFQSLLIFAAVAVGLLLGRWPAVETVALATHALRTFNRYRSPPCPFAHKGEKWANGQGGDQRPPEARFLPSGLSQRPDPALHALLHVLDIRLGEEVFQLHSIHRIDQTMEVLLITVRHGSVYSHTTFELRICGRPLLITGRHTLGAHESLTTPAR